MKSDVYVGGISNTLVEKNLKRIQELLQKTEFVTHIGSWEWDIASDAMLWTDGLFQIVNRPPTLVAPSFAEQSGILSPEDFSALKLRVSRAVKDGLPFDIEVCFIRPDGAIRNCLYCGLAEKNEQGVVIRLFGSVRDITEQKRSEAQRIKLENQLQQTQKMDSVGRLAGGVAHDFNNMLTVILGCTNQLLEQVDASHTFYEDLNEIRQAANRSSELARRLLAFARKQAIDPRELALNETVAGMQQMIRQMIGENIKLNWQPSPGVWPVKMDASQLDQVVANLCINAHDAINGMGNISIETRNVSFDEDFCSQNVGFSPGDYVCLSLSDDGCGMNKETLAHIFEPFFTTKRLGEGTGLGLSMVYGIISQNKGFIKVYSEPGQGSTFSLYLPRFAPIKEAAPVPVIPVASVAGHGTVLLVEDEASVLKMTARMLEKLGYTVLIANNPENALALARQYSGNIDLLMTDVIMPGMNGLELSKAILPLFPRIKRLFMSGYTANILPDQGALNEGAYFIQKPFIRQDLSSRIIDIMDS